ncbi:unnamed protein product, partial [Meganyctiphanes norvegica]
MQFAPFSRPIAYLAGKDQSVVKRIATKLCKMCSITESPQKLQLPHPEDAAMERVHGVINSAMRNIFATSPASPLKKCAEAKSASPLKKCAEATSAPGSPAKLLLAPSLLSMMNIDLTQKQ